MVCATAVRAAAPPPFRIENHSRSGDPSPGRWHFRGGGRLRVDRDREWDCPGILTLAPARRKGFTGQPRRDAAATRRPADATGCIGKSAPVRDREADDPGLRNRVEARAQPHPPAPRSPLRAALSLAPEGFAEKQASGSRPCPVARRSRFRPDPSVRGRGSARLHFFSRPRRPRYRKRDVACVSRPPRCDRFATTNWIVSASQSDDRIRGIGLVRLGPVAR
jgi:hypothetical protein